MENSLSIVAVPGKEAKPSLHIRFVDAQIARGYSPSPVQTSSCCRSCPGAPSKPARARTLLQGLGRFVRLLRCSVGSNGLITADKLSEFSTSDFHKLMRQGRWHGLRRNIA